MVTRLIILLQEWNKILMQSIECGNKNICELQSVSSMKDVCQIPA